MFLTQYTGARASGTTPPEVEPATAYDSFEGSGAMNSELWDTYDPQLVTGVVAVTQANNQYTGDVTGTGNPGEWYQGNEGLLHYVTLNGDFDFIARNIGINSGANDADFQFCGVLCWLSQDNWEFAVAGNRAGDAHNTIEYKTTISGSSNQSDTNNDSITSYKCDLRVVRSVSGVDFYYQQPNTVPDSWTLLNHDGLNGGRVAFGTGNVRVGLISYGFASPDDFIGTCDQVEIPTGVPL